tara:strand:- start:327 stop:1031 length:705 start_codon:yes stop_codon:yes gene_type:complete
LINSQNEHAFIIESEDGEVLENNQVLEFNSVQYPNASFIFFVRNLTSEAINVRAEVLNISGTDGSMMEFCFGECYFGVDLNTPYPLNSFVTVEPGETQTSVGDHFFNQDPGDGTNPVSFQFRFYMVDSEGNEVMSIPELMTDYFVTYQYQAQSFSLEENFSENIQLYLNEKILTITAPLEYTVSLFDISAKNILTTQLNEGINSIDVSNITNGIYILKVHNDFNGSDYRKILLN